MKSLRPVRLSSLTCTQK